MEPWQLRVLFNQNSSPDRRIPVLQRDLDLTNGPLPPEDVGLRNVGSLWRGTWKWIASALRGAVSFLDFDFFIVNSSTSGCLEILALHPGRHDPANLISNIRSTFYIHTL